MGRKQAEAEGEKIMPEVLRGVWTKGKLALAADTLCHGEKRFLISEAVRDTA